MQAPPAHSPATAGDVGAGCSRGVSVEATTAAHLRYDGHLSQSDGHVYVVLCWPRAVWPDLPHPARCDTAPGNRATCVKEYTAPLLLLTQPCIEWGDFGTQLAHPTHWTSELRCPVVGMGSICCNNLLFYTWLERAQIRACTYV